MRYRCPICSFEFIGGGFCPSPYHVATTMVELPEREDNREMKNFIAYSAQIDEQEFFETHEEALEWLKKSDLEGADEGFSLEACEGGSFIAKITHRSQYVEEDNKENYCQCEDENCENEHWDYSHDSVGHIEYKEVSYV